jgi:hypothetical protein
LVTKGTKAGASATSIPLHVQVRPLLVLEIESA